MEGALTKALTNPHKTAALAYGVLGVSVIAITFAADLVPPSRMDAIGQLVVGGLFVLLFAVLIYWRGWWLLSALLVLTNAWRAINYFSVGLGLHADLRALSITSIEPKPIAFVNAALMAVIVFLLVRSAWIGFSDWRTRHSAKRRR